VILISQLAKNLGEKEALKQVLELNECLGFLEEYWELLVAPPQMKNEDGGGLELEELHLTSEALKPELLEV